MGVMRSAQHNLHHLMDLIQSTRSSIQDGSFEAFLQRFYSHSV